MTSRTIPPHPPQESHHRDPATSGDLGVSERREEPASQKPETTSPPSGRRKSARWKRPALILGLALTIAAAATWLVWTSVGSPFLVHRVERVIEQATGRQVEVGGVEPTLGGVALRDLVLVSETHRLSLRAAVARVDLELEDLTHPTGRDVTVQLEDVLIARAGLASEEGSESLSQIAAPRITVTRRSDGSISSRGEGRASTGGSVAWDLATTGGLEELSGTLTLASFPVAAARDLFADALPFGELLSDATPAVADARLRLSPAPDSQGLSIRGSIRVDSLSLESPRLADLPVELGRLAFDGELRIAPTTRSLDIAPSIVTLDGVPTRLEGSLELGTAPPGSDTALASAGPDDGSLVRADLPDRQASRRLALALDLELPPTACNAVLGAIPAELLAPFDRFWLEGTLGGDLSVRVDTAAPEATALDVAFDDRCRFVSAPDEARLERFAGPFLHVAEDAEGNDFALTTGPGTAAWVDLEQVSPYLIQAVIAHEDATFARHAGFATFAIEDSLEENLRAGRFVRGASTLSMQLAKNLFLGRDRTLARKVREVILTWWLEDQLDKREILELYLNVIELGPEIYGVRQAARHYFHQDPSKLTPAQAVFLATLLPNPVDRHRQLEADALRASTKREMQDLLHHMRRRGRIGQEALEFGLWEIGRRSFFHPTLAEALSGPQPPLAADAAGLDSATSGR